MVVVTVSTVLELLSLAVMVMGELLVDSRVRVALSAVAGIDVWGDDGRALVGKEEVSSMRVIVGSSMVVEVSVGLTGTCVTGGWCGSSGRVRVWKSREDIEEVEKGEKVVGKVRLLSLGLSLFIASSLGSNLILRVKDDDRELGTIGTLSLISRQEFNE